MMKHLLYFMCVRAAYWLGIDALFYWLNRRAKRILCFHHVMPDAVHMSGINGFELNETEFRSCIRELKKRFWFSTDVDDARTLTLTFDDGWRNQYTTAARVLHEEGDIPAILFVSGRMIDNRDPLCALSMELVLHWSRFVPYGTYSLRVKGHEYRLVIENENERRETGRVIYGLYLEDGDSRGQDLLKALNAVWPLQMILNDLPAGYVENRLQGITMAELKELRVCGWKIGWHTHSHFPLKRLSVAAQREELTPTFGVDRAVMAYPFGSPDAVDKETMNIADELGYDRVLSFMSEPGPNYCPKFMPRYHVPTEKYELHFVLSGLKHFLKYRRLLPVV